MVRVAIYIVLLVSLNGCATAYILANGEDKLDERLSVPMTKEQVLEELGKPDKVLRDDGRQITWEYRLYPPGAGFESILWCVGLLSCTVWPQPLSAPYYVVLIDDQLCMWGPPQVVNTRKTCKSPRTANQTQGSSKYTQGSQSKATPEEVRRAEAEAILALKAVGLDESYLNEVYREIDHLEVRDPGWFDRTPAQKQFPELAQRVLKRVRRAQGSVKSVPDSPPAENKPQGTTGSGFLIGRGYILTNDHVIANMSKLTI